MATLIATTATLVAESPQEIPTLPGWVQALLGLVIFALVIFLVSRVVTRAQADNTERFTELLSASDERLRERGRRMLEADVVFLGSVARDERKVEAVTPALIKEVRARVDAALTETCREIHERKALPIRNVKAYREDQQV